MATGIELFPLLARYERGLAPLKEAEPDANVPAAVLSIGLGDDLAMLLTKVSPGMSADQSDAWIKVMVTALGDLPGRVSREAAQAALHRPIKFVSEIEDIVRKFAEGLMARHRLACGRLREMAAEAHRRTVAADDDRGPLTDEEIRRMTPEIRSMGLTCGALTQEQVDRALTAPPPDQQAA